MYQTTEDVAADNGERWPRAGTSGPDWNGRLELESSMRSGLVVVVRVCSNGALEVPSAPDERPVQALGADRPYPSFGEGILLHAWQTIPFLIIWVSRSFPFHGGRHQARSRHALPLDGARNSPDGGHERAVFRSSLRR
jgi:hypothetical protein